MHLSATRVPTIHRDEDGAALLLAVIFIAVIAVVLVAILSLTGNDLKSTSNLQSQRSLEYAADGVTDTAVQIVRHSNLSYTSAGNCTPGGGTSPVTIDGVGMEVYCTGSATSGSEESRVVTFYACSWGISQNACLGAGTPSRAVVEATVAFDDYQNFSDNCSTTGTTCGAGMMISSWVVETANS